VAVGESVSVIVGEPVGDGDGSLVASSHKHVKLVEQST